MNQEIYDLLGSPILTVEIVEYLMEQLRQSDRFKPIELFERLHNFYDAWCEGTFIDALLDENLPQRKMRLLREQLPEQEKSLGIRQIDVYAGLNVMILLLELHRHAQEREELEEKIVFYPGGQLTEGERYTSRLLKIISYSDCVKLAGFSSIVGAFLSYVNLTSADLDSANLTSANLTSADLDSANLTSANLTSADLTRANLTSADLDSANLTSANFTRANFTFANLIRANLISANFTSAYLDSANFTSANFTRANLTRADLISANLTSANLTFADLSFADLTSAYLDSANLTSANLTFVNLTRADLISANLTSANLTFADLSFADLTSANFTSANLDNISWDEETNWEGVRGLETARNVPIALKQQLGLE